MPYEPFRDYLTDLDASSCSPCSREHELIPCHCEECLVEIEARMTCDYDLRAEPLPDCPSCGSPLHAGDLDEHANGTLSPVASERPTACSGEGGVA